MTALNTNQFLSILAHDLRSPLISLESGLKLIEMAEEDHDWRQVGFFRREMMTRLERTQNLLDSLLEWAGDSCCEGENSPGADPYLSDLLTEVENLLADSLKEKAITIRHNFYARRIPSRERAAVSFLLRNLVSNAVKFSHAGGVIRIKAQRHRTYLELMVSDDGVGMDSETLRRIREGRSQEPRHGTARERGHGLGLMLCRQLVQEIGGRLSVDSAPSCGTTFRLFLPETA